MAPHERITLLVEGQYDQMLVGWILEAAGLPVTGSTSPSRVES